MLRLYERIKNEWLVEFIGKGYISLVQEGIGLNERDIGNYMIDKLELQFGDKCAILEPVGTNTIGGEGRVDLYLSGEKAFGYMLILLRNTENEDEWYLVDRKKRSEHVPFSKDVLEEVMEQWLAE